jgi:hypothetical protein
MKSERPLIASVLSLAAGLSLIFGYCNGTSSLNASYPMAASVLHLDVTTTGPAALGGLALTILGVLLLVWALLVAILSQISGLFNRSHSDERVTPSERIFG